jgi:3-deoxy-manno-octulosonate cytidylyltransferase (CMP-KDO synthetase)
MAETRVGVVIPARYGSTRFPGKPMAPVLGVSLIERVWRICRAVTGTALVCVATDDERIARFVEGFGARAVMTPVACRTGSDRTWAALQALPEHLDAAVNVQGDAVLTPPWAIQALVDVLRADPDSPIVTPAVRLDAERLAAFEASKVRTPASGTTVVRRADGFALYFSKRVIPYLRASGEGAAAVHRHIGIYGYRRAALERFAALPTGALETAEGLEQLRALENGIPIRVVDVDYRGRTHWSIDAPEDVAAAEAIIQAEGELA